MQRTGRVRCVVCALHAGAPNAMHVPTFDASLTFDTHALHCLGSHAAHGVYVGATHGSSARAAHRFYVHAAHRPPFHATQRPVPHAAHCFYIRVAHVAAYSAPSPSHHAAHTLAPHVVHLAAAVAAYISACRVSFHPAALYQVPRHAPYNLREMMTSEDHDSALRGFTL